MLLYFFLLFNFYLFSYSSFYKHWKNLPYCTNEEEIPKTAIQPLTPNQLLHDLELVQVHVLARHGARAPFTTKMSCWEAKPNPIEIPWNCSYLSVNSYDVNTTTNEYGRLYHHIFNSGFNQLNGTCKLGALLPFGIYQHHENGKLLQNAYIGEGKLKLFVTHDLAKIRPSDLYLRSDDLERTIASGHALLNGMFPPDKESIGDKPNSPILSWHLQDFATDILYPNPNLCPILSELSDAAVSSSEFYAFSMDSLELQTQLNSILGDFKWEEMYECAALARCNDIPLPNGVTEEMFDKILNNTQYRAYIQLTFDSSFYSKLSMTPLLNYIFDEGIGKAVKDPINESKLRILMVHDSTHMALLAALLGKKWDGIWSTYASLFNIELYKINHPILQNDTNSTRRFGADETHAIRFLYKGVPLHIPACFDELCGLKQIQEYISFRVPFAHCDDVTANIKKDQAIINLKSLSERKLLLGKFIFYFTIFGSFAAVIILLLHANYQRHRSHMRENETSRLLY